MSGRGKRRLVLDGNTFYAQQSSGFRTRWMCTLHSRGCKAAVHTYDEEIVKLPVSGFTRCNLELRPVFSMSLRGNPVIIIGQHRFNRVKRRGDRSRWVCVKAKAGCRAALTTMHNTIVRVTRMHDPIAHTTPNRCRNTYMTDITVSATDTP
ncbi:FLYWCH zinc finger domain-containing protein [Phthorimaea operculella]|nr:FLYWCH zinc finger domain-containing protein [Phthorimaea operculella]